MFTRHLMLPIETNLGHEIVTDLSNDVIFFYQVGYSKLHAVSYNKNVVKTLLLL